MISKIITSLFIIALTSTAFSANTSSTRRCVYTGMSAKCGEARAIVECEGYSEAHYLSDDVAITNLSSGLNKIVKNEAVTVKEVHAALAKSEITTTELEVETDAASNEGFEIPRDVKLYKSCFKAKGEAQPNETPNS